MLWVCCIHKQVSLHVCGQPVVVSWGLTVWVMTTGMTNGTIDGERRGGRRRHGCFLWWSFAVVCTFAVAWKCLWYQNNSLGNSWNMPCSTAVFKIAMTSGLSTQSRIEHRSLKINVDLKQINRCLTVMVVHVTTRTVPWWRRGKNVSYIRCKWERESWEEIPKTVTIHRDGKSLRGRTQCLCHYPQNKKGFQHHNLVWACWPIPYVI